MISYILPDAALGAEDREIPYGLAGGKPQSFLAPSSEWPARAGIGQRVIRPHVGPIKRQQFNDCTANMATKCMEIVRSQAGLPFVSLSSTALYSHINGGRDVGSNLHTAAEHMTKVGCVPVSMWPVDTWRMREPADYADMAAKYRGLEWVDIPSASGVITGIGWYGRPVGIGVRWGTGGHAITVVDYDYRDSVPKEHLNAYLGLVRHFDQFDSEFSTMCGDSLDGRNEPWFQIVNSWGESWGENGFGWLPWSQVDSGVRNRYGGICLTSATFTF